MSAGLDYLRGGDPRRSDDDPWRHRLHPERCPELGHPACTYNSWSDRTWCLCGERTYTGDAVERVGDALSSAHCGGPLSECLGPDQTSHPCPEAGR